MPTHGQLSECLYPELSASAEPVQPSLKSGAHINVKVTLSWGLYKQRKREGRVGGHTCFLSLPAGCAENGSSPWTLLALRVHHLDLPTGLHQDLGLEPCGSTQWIEHSWHLLEAD